MKQKSPILSAILLLVLCLLTYSNGLRGNFLIDDHKMLLGDVKAHDLKFFSYFFLSDKGLSQIQDGPTEYLDYYRPLAEITPMVFYHFFRDNPFGYHVANLFLFWVIGLLIFHMLNLLQPDRRVSFLTSALFCVHPINGMLINYITADVYEIQLIALLISTITFLLFCDGKKPLVAHSISILAFLISLLCHETSLALPLYLTAAAALGRGIKPKEAFLKCIPYFAIALIYFLFRLEHASIREKIIANIPIFHATLPQYLAAFSKLVHWYLSKLISLDNIALLWAVKIAIGSTLPWILGFFCFLTACFTAIFYWHKRNILSLGLSWLLIGFLPVTLGCLAYPESGLVIEPHWLFFSSIGFFLTAASLLIAVSQRIGKRAFFLLLAVILFSNVLVSRNNNRIWADEITYCRYWLGIAPDSKAAVFLASAYQQKGEWQNAKDYYQKSLKNNFEDWQIYNNLGLIAYHEGVEVAAEKYYRQALNIHPRSARTYNNLGLVFQKNSSLGRAKEAFRTALRLDPYLVEPRLNLALLLRREGKIGQAQRLYEENLKIDPGQAASIFNLTEIHLEAGKRSEALEIIQSALKNSNNTSLLIDLGRLSAENGLPKSALACYLKALAKEPRNTRIFAELGKLSARLGQFDAAIQFWKDGLKIDPADNTLKNLLAQLAATKTKNNLIHIQSKR